jgi:hypothetical protein
MDTNGQALSTLFLHYADVSFDVQLLITLFSK